MQRIMKALAVLMLSLAVVFAAGCKKTEDPNNGSNEGGSENGSENGNGGNGGVPTLTTEGIYLGIIGFNQNQYEKEWLKDVFKDTIIPLLQEYFYGDYKKIFYVLGPGFVEKKTEKTIFAVDSDVYELDISDERYDIVSFDTEFKIENAIENMKVQKTEADKVETKIPEEVTKTEESTDKK